MKSPEAVNTTSPSNSAQTKTLRGKVRKLPTAAPRHRNVGNLLKSAVLNANEKETQNVKTLWFGYQRRTVCGGFGVCAVGDAYRG
jgi:hypothetical protein